MVGWLCVQRVAAAVAPNVRRRSPGGDIPQRLTLKNASNEIVRLLYRLPATKYFYMEFPKLITLSPGGVAQPAGRRGRLRRPCAGTELNLTVSFRPTVAEEYHDHIEFMVFPKASAQEKMSSKMGQVRTAARSGGRGRSWHTRMSPRVPGRRWQAVPTESSRSFFVPVHAVLPKLKARVRLEGAGRCARACVRGAVGHGRPAR
jgi:hypothetical protein